MEYTNEDEIGQLRSWVAEMDKENEQLKARVAELEAQLARTWQPVEDAWSSFSDELWYQTSIEVTENGGVLLVGDNEEKVILPDGVRLCRHTYG
jgi:predicted RNase H-like nuclease (RuvC/YqgF family)